MNSYSGDHTVDSQDVLDEWVFAGREVAADGREETTGPSIGRHVTTWKPAVLRPGEFELGLQLQLLVEQLHGAAWTTDAELRVTSWMGIVPAEVSIQPDQIVGLCLPDIFRWDASAPSAIALHQEALQGTSRTAVLRWHERVYDIRVEPLRDGISSIIGTAGVAQDVTEQLQAQLELCPTREELDRRVEARTAELRNLYEQAQEAAVLQERQRLARDLHDAVTQMLFSASLIAEVLPRIWERDQGKARQHLEDLRMLTRGALAEMRTLLLELRPAALSEARLGDLLQQVAEALMGKIGVPVILTVRDARGRRAEPLPPDVRTTLYRVAQEALNNVAKHAEASQVTIELDLHLAQVDLAIRDDGKGFDSQSVTADHLGLDIMRERVAAIGGTLTIESHRGHGTVIHVRWQG